jgi:hypothetical protein
VTTTTAGIVFLLAAIALTGLVLIGIIVESDDDDVDAEEHADWDRLR